MATNAQTVHKSYKTFLRSFNIYLKHVLKFVSFSAIYSIVNVRLWLNQQIRSEKKQQQDAFKQENRRYKPESNRPE